MEFASVPAGRFIMGNSEHEDERPAHSVVFADAFWMQATEVTQRQWTAVMGTSPWSNMANVREGDAYPAVFVSWPDGKAFVQRLNELDPGRSYRLPSEAEWEYACRAGRTDADSAASGREALADVAWFDENASGVGENWAHPVGLKKPNAWGLYDMQGNVWEWCEDPYHDSYVGAGADGAAWSAPEGASHVYRGGGFRNARRFARAAGRAGLDDEDFADNIGFRVVMGAERSAP